MEEEKLSIELTGNPFVDTGLGVISVLAKIDDIDDFSFADIKSVYGDGSQLTDWNSKLKTFTQIFGTNNPLLQQAYGDPIPGKRRKKVPSATNTAIYKRTLALFIDEIEKLSKGPRCWACGTPSNFNFGKPCNQAILESNREPKEYKSIGRDWFPLAGSLGSDAQALPGASQYPHICPKCIFAIHYLPIGLILLDGRLAVFQCTSTRFWYELVSDVVSRITMKKSRLYSRPFGSLWLHRRKRRRK